MSAQSYRDLIVWQKAMGFVQTVYSVSRNWPKDELFGLTGQARRAAVSVPANIAEGKGRLGARECLHHLSIAHGSLGEAETHLLIARHLAFIDEDILEPMLRQTAEVGRLLQGLMRSLRPSPDA